MMTGESYEQKKARLETETYPQTMQELRNQLGEENELSCRAAYIAAVAAEHMQRMKDISEAFVAITLAGKGDGAREVRADEDFPELIRSNATTLWAVNDHLWEQMHKFLLEFDTE